MADLIDRVTERALPPLLEVMWDLYWRLHDAQRAACLRRDDRLPTPSVTFGQLMRAKGLGPDVLMDETGVGRSVAVQWLAGLRPGESNARVLGRHFGFNHRAMWPR